MRRADTEQREAGRSRGTEKDLVRAAAEGARCYIYTPTADKHRSRQQEGQSGQDLPITSRHPPERQEPPYHPTQREEEVEGGERERTGQTCEARRTQARRRDEHGDRDETATLGCKRCFFVFDTFPVVAAKLICARASGRRRSPRPNRRPTVSQGCFLLPVSRRQLAVLRRARSRQFHAKVTFSDGSVLRCRAQRASLAHAVL